MAVVLCILFVSCAQYDPIGRWRVATVASEKVKAAEALVHQRVLIGLTRDEVVARLGTATAKDSYLSYVLDKGTSPDPTTLVTLLVCHIDQAGRVDSCVVQRD